MFLEKFCNIDVNSLIADKPACPRDFSRLMVLNRQKQTIEHCLFGGILNYFKKGDCLVINNSKVFPAKLIGKKISGGKFELLLIRQAEKPNMWLALSAECKSGIIVNFKNGLNAKAVKKTCNGEWLFEFSSDNILAYAEKYGLMPIPNYIVKQRKKHKTALYTAFEKTNYQTVFAKNYGSVAAPTAGFHFTDELLKKIKLKGVEVAEITLHVGWGTFKPIRGSISEHKMLGELSEISKEAAEKINSAKKIFSVGTTTTRTLESFAEENKKISFGRKWADIFIYPPYKFKSVDALITNFHLPNSTPLCLAAAFAGEEFLFKAYEEAQKNNYRFYSYGDAMLIL